MSKHQQQETPSLEQSAFEFLADFSRLQRSGMKHKPAFELLQDCAPIENGVRDLIRDVGSKVVDRGASFASALESYPSTFDPIHVLMVRAGEHSGAMAEAIDQIVTMDKTDINEASNAGCTLLKIPLELRMFSHKLGYMIGVGVPIVEALEAAGADHNPDFSKAVTSVVRSVKQGCTLSEALTRNGEVFVEPFISLVQVGEETTELDNVLKNIATWGQ